MSTRGLRGGGKLSLGLEGHQPGKTGSWIADRNNVLLGHAKLWKACYLVETFGCLPQKLISIPCKSYDKYACMAFPLFQVDDAYVLLWDFADLIHPMLKLESPHEIFCFRFNPSIPGVSELVHRVSWRTDSTRVPCSHCCVYGKITPPHEPTGELAT